MKKLTENAIALMEQFGARRWTNYGKDRLYIGAAYGKIAEHIHINGIRESADSEERDLSLVWHESEISNTVRRNVWHADRSNDYINLQTGEYVNRRSIHGNGGNTSACVNRLFENAEMLEIVLNEMVSEEG